MDARILRDMKLADVTVEHLLEDIEQMKSELLEDEELEVTYYPGPPDKAIRVASFGYHNPYVIRLEGIDEAGREAAVLVHMSALALVLTTRKRS